MPAAPVIHFKQSAWSLIFRVSVLCLIIVFLFGTERGYAQTVSTWIGGAGNWEPCPQQGGNALWNTCPTYPSGNFDAVIEGGPVTDNGGISIVNLSVAASDSLIITPGYLDITGTSIVNNGSISIGSGNGLIIVAPATVTLNGSGTLTMTTSDTRIGGANSGAGFINQEAIEGQGALGLGTLAITNQGTINSSGGTLNIQPSATGLINSGSMVAQSGSTMVLAAGVPLTYNNSGGTIEALDNATILVETNISGGNITTAGTGIFTLAPPGAGAGLTNLTNSGTFNIPAGGGLNWQGTITNNGTFQLDGSISTNGNVTLQGSGSVIMKNGSVDGLGANPLTNKQLIHGSGTFFDLPLINQATIQADDSSTPLNLSESTTTNTAALQASGGGTLQISNLVNNTGGTIQALSTSTVDLIGTVSGGTLKTSGSGLIQAQNGTLDGTVNIPTNAGLLNVKDFNLFFQGTINNTGTISLTGNGCAILTQPSTLTGAGRLTMVSTACIFGSGNTFTNRSTIQGAGSIGDSNPMPITNQGSILANSSSPMVIHPDASGFTNTGKLKVNPGSTLNITGQFNNLIGGILSGGTYVVSGIMGFPSSVATSAANITINGAAAEIFNTSSSTNALASLAANTSKGILSLQKGQTLSTASSLSNAGKLTVGTSSSLSLAGSYTQTAGMITVDGTLTAPAGFALQKGSLLGQGTIAAAVTSSAIVTVGDATTKAGKLSVRAYTQNATGMLNVAIGGLTAGTQYSQLAVSNGASLNGTLNIKLINGFVPAIGNTFTILTGTAVTGTFSTVNGLSINSGEHFAITYNSTNVILTAVSGP